MQEIFVLATEPNVDKQKLIQISNLSFQALIEVAK